MTSSVAPGSFFFMMNTPSPVYLETPSTSHADYSIVYEPSEDSFYLIDALQGDAEFLRTRLSGGPPPLIVEVGVGSGVILAAITAHGHELLGRRDFLTFGTDVNEYAGPISIHTIESHVNEHNGPNYNLLDVANADLVTPFRDGLIDILFFNPPYVPSEEVPEIPENQWPVDGETETDRKCRELDLLAIATDGGNDGMEVTNRFLQELPRVLSQDRGVAYVLLSIRNKPDQVKQRIREWGNGWSAEKVFGAKAGWEILEIIRIWRMSQ